VFLLTRATAGPKAPASRAERPPRCLWSCRFPCRMARRQPTAVMPPRRRTVIRWEPMLTRA